MEGRSMLANGTISPSRFVALSTTTGKVDQVAATTTLPCGISGMQTHKLPLAGLQDGFHATVGEMCQVFGVPHLRVPLEYGGTVTANDLLGPDSSGRGVTVTADHAVYGARAYQSGVLGDIKEVEPLQAGMISV